MIKVLIPDLPTPDEILPFMRMAHRNRWYSNNGPLVKELEEEFSNKFFDGAHVVTTSSGTTALQLLLQVVGAGSFTRMQALSFPATALAAFHARGWLSRIEWMDIDPDTWRASRLAWQKQEKSATLVPVCTYGSAYGDVKFEGHTGQVVIDAAGAIGNQRLSKECPHVHAAFSLHATKTFGIGEGGLAVTWDEAVANKVRQLANFGFDPELSGRVLELGTNAKMSEIHAAVGLAMMRKWPQVVARRAALHEEYLFELGRICPTVRVQRRSMHGVYSLLVVELPRGIGGAYAIRTRMEERGVETRRWYWPPQQVHPPFLALTFPSGEMLNTTDVAPRLLGLPFHPFLSSAEIKTVCRNLQLSLEEQL